MGNKEIKKIYLESEHGWLDTEGFLHRCAYGDHDRMGGDHITEHGYDTNMGKVYGCISITNCLELNGWIKIQKKLAYSPNHVGFDDEWFVTKGQLNFIYAYYDFHGNDKMSYPELRIK